MKKLTILISILALLNLSIVPAAYAEESKDSGGPGEFIALMAGATVGFLLGYLIMQKIVKKEQKETVSFKINDKIDVSYNITHSSFANST